MVSDILRNIGRLFTWLIVVAPWEQVIRVRLGSRVRLLNAGAYFRIPFIDRIYRQSTRRRLNIISSQALTTSDGKSLTVACTIGYTIVDLMKLYQTLHDASDTIESEVSAVVAGYVSSKSFKECAPKCIESHVRESLKLEEYGLGNVEFYVTNFAAVRTLRVISGPIKDYSYSARLETCNEESARPG